MELSNKTFDKKRIKKFNVVCTIDSIHKGPFKRMLISFLLFIIIRILATILQTRAFEKQSEYCDTSSKNIDVMGVDLTFNSLFVFHRKIVLFVSPYIKEEAKNASTIAFDYDIEALYIANKKIVEKSYNGSTKHIYTKEKEHQIELIRFENATEIEQIQVHVSIYADFKKYRGLRFKWEYSNFINDMVEIALPFCFLWSLSQFIFNNEIKDFHVSQLINLLLCLVTAISTIPFDFLFGSNYQFLSDLATLFLVSLIRVLVIFQCNELTSTNDYKTIINYGSVLINFFKAIVTIKILQYSKYYSVYENILAFLVICETVISVYTAAKVINESNETINGKKVIVMLSLIALNIVFSAVFENTLLVSTNVLIAMFKSKTMLVVYATVSLFYLYMMNPKQILLVNEEEHDEVLSENDLQERVVFENAKEENENIEDDDKIIVDIEDANSGQE